MQQAADQAQQLLDYHRAEQEQMLSAMDLDSSIMRDAALAIGETITADQARFVKLATLNDENSTALARERNRIRSQIGRTCGVTWLAVVVLVVAVLVFVWTVMMMRVFRK